LFAVPRQSRSDNWGFPRWGDYGKGREAQTQRTCDRVGCDQPGICPAPKSAYSRTERWWFCADHAAEYNKSWDYFQGLNDQEAKARAESENAQARAYSRADHWAWAGPGQDGESRATLDALATLELESGASETQIKAAFRKLAKKYHPDANPNDAQAADRFHRVRVAYDYLTAQPGRG
jgi:hypothetical protein